MTSWHIKLLRFFMSGLLFPTLWAKYFSMATTIKLSQQKLTLPEYLKMLVKIQLCAFLKATSYCYLRIALETIKFLFELCTNSEKMSLWLGGSQRQLPADMFNVSRGQCPAPTCQHSRYAYLQHISERRQWQGKRTRHSNRAVEQLLDKDSSGYLKNNGD